LLSGRQPDLQVSNMISARAVLLPAVRIVASHPAWCWRNWHPISALSVPVVR
jgi:hypothetical protein